MRILIVEDDHLQADWISDGLREAFPRCELIVINTESGFRDRLEEFRRRPPDIAIIDVMLRWNDPAPDMVPPPREVQAEGFYRAGLRCQQLLAGAESTRRIPVILYTMLERSDLAEDMDKVTGDVVYLRKETDLEPLVNEIRDRAVSTAQE